MTKNLFLSLFLLWSAWVGAQAPGYLGKKIIVQVDGHAIPAIFGPNMANRGLFAERLYGGTEEVKLGMSWRVGMQASYVISRRHQLYLLADYLKTGMKMDAYTANLAGSNVEYDQHNLFYNLRGITIGLGYRRFKLGYAALAPMGRYSGWSLQYSIIEGEILDKRTSYAFGDGSQGHGKLGINPKAGLVSLGYDFGNNFIIADCIVLNLGARINIPLTINVWKGYVKEDDGTYGLPESPEKTAEFNTERFKLRSQGRLAVHSLFTFYGGIGFVF